MPAKKPQLRRVEITRVPKDKSFAFGKFDGLTVFIPPPVLDRLARNRKNQILADQLLFLVFDQRKKNYKAMDVEHTSEITWEEWQAGPRCKQLFETVGGMEHGDLSMACWKCGETLLAGKDIYKIKGGCIWTKKIPDTIRGNGTKTFNKYKKVFMESALCKACGYNVGSIYNDRYQNEEDPDKPFPCCKLIHTRQRALDSKVVNCLVVKADSAKAMVEILHEIHGMGVPDLAKCAHRVSRQNYDLSTRLRQQLEISKPKECKICLNKFYPTKGIECSSCNCCVCDDCFTKHAKEDACKQLKHKNLGDVSCPECRETMPHQEIMPHLSKEAYGLVSKARENKMRSDITAEIAREQEAEQQAREEEDNVSSVARRIGEFFTIKYPCKHPVMMEDDFKECFALRCPEQACADHYCAWCLRRDKDGVKAHDHVAACADNPFPGKGIFFVSKEDVNKFYDFHFQRKIQDFVRKEKAKGMNQASLKLIHSAVEKLLDGNGEYLPHLLRRGSVGRATCKCWLKKILRFLPRIGRE